MPRINLVGAPLLTQRFPAVPTGSQPGTPIFTQRFPAIPTGSQPGTPLDVMVRTAALEASRILASLKNPK